MVDVSRGSKKVSCLNIVVLRIRKVKRIGGAVPSLAVNEGTVRYSKMFKKK